MNKGFWASVTILAGTIIGAGVFSLPYIFREVGFLRGVLYLVFFACVYFVIHSMYAATLETNAGNHQFFFYAKRFLKKPFSGIAPWVILGELILVLAVYLILVPTFVSLVFGSNNVVLLIVFWFLGSIFIFARLKWLGLAEFVGAIGIVAIIFTLFLTGILKGSAFSLSSKSNFNLLTFLLPFGPLLFSLSGRPAISKVVEEHKKASAIGRSFSLRKSIFLGTFIPAALYFLFAFGVLRLNPNITPETLNGLNFLSQPLLFLLGCMGLLTIWTSYFMVAINIKDTLVVDLGWKRGIAAIFIFALPLALYFAGFQNFISAISLTGGIFLGLEGMFVTAMWHRAFPNHHFRQLAPLLYLIFGTAIVYEIARFIL